MIDCEDYSVFRESQCLGVKFEPPMYVTKDHFFYLSMKYHIEEPDEEYCNHLIESIREFPLEEINGKVGFIPGFPELSGPRVHKEKIIQRDVASDAPKDQVKKEDL